MFAFLFAGELLYLTPLILVWFIAGLFCLVNEDNPRDGWMTVFTIGALALGATLFQPEIVNLWNTGVWSAKLGTFAAYAAGYLVCGLVYASLRILRKAKKQATALQANWTDSNIKLNDINAVAALHDFMRYKARIGHSMVSLKWNTEAKTVELTPVKLKIVGWLSSYTAYWLVYVIVFFTHDIIEWLIDNLYGALVRRIMKQFDGFKASMNASVVNK